MEVSQKIVGLLLEWFAREQRDLPWRKNYEPYQVWISEIMLQQTQVKTVLPYFERWMAALPNVAAVAEAEEDMVLKLWEGLGYYSRARNIQNAARVMVETHGAQVPTDYEALLALPGVGPYTAGAIASIAFEQDQAVVDGNVIRVLARLADFRGEVKPGPFWKLAESLLPSGQARNFNQALMEFGALACTPKNPSCESCPLAQYCKARAAKTVDIIPKKKASKKQRIKVAVGVIQKDGKYFIQKRLPDGLMPGLWEFPGGKVEESETAEAALEREIREELGVEIGNIQALTKIKHAYTSFLVDLHCFLADYKRGHIQLSAASESKWVELDELSDFPFPAANVKLIDLLTKRVKNS